eukprot:GHVR01037177.1.p2 GENE.GHVR01037177.1~~GHVR01037177.1.p2  ORF type:complete len:126 (+),score=28.05 GHVR01037177.1:549-926(+)
MMVMILENSGTVWRERWVHPCWVEPVRRGVVTAWGELKDLKPTQASETQASEILKESTEEDTLTDTNHNDNHVSESEPIEVRTWGVYDGDLHGVDELQPVELPLIDNFASAESVASTGLKYSNLR